MDHSAPTVTPSGAQHAQPNSPNPYEKYAPSSLVAGPAFGEKPTRSAILQRKKQLKEVQDITAKEARQEPAESPERNRLYRQIREICLESEQLEETLQTRFVPQHGEEQLISPRAFFVSPLFRVAGRQTPREIAVSLSLLTQSKASVLRYSGPELRQSDGLVFMTLLRIARDAQVGCDVSFSPEDLCREIFGRYSGPARTLLRDHIQRLQKGLIAFPSFSVQLCQRFNYPSRGLWSVALDKDIVAVFGQSSAVWLDREQRKRIPEGLSSWLFSFIESQTKLIPTSVDSLHKLCGSDAEPESFVRLLRRALNDLEEAGVVDEGWSVAKGVVRWRKAVKKVGG